MAIRDMRRWKNDLSSGTSKMLALVGGLLASVALVGVLIGLVTIKFVTLPALVVLGGGAVAVGYATPYFMAYWLTGPSPSTSEEGLPS